MLRYAGFSASPVSVDSEGMQPEKLEQALNRGARAVILTPRAHNPTGCSLSVAVPLRCKIYWRVTLR